MTDCAARLQHCGHDPLPSRSKAVEERLELRAAFPSERLQEINQNESSRSDPI